MTRMNHLKDYYYQKGYEYIGKADVLAAEDIYRGHEKAPFREELSFLFAEDTIVDALDEQFLDFDEEITQVMSFEELGVYQHLTDDLEIEGFVLDEEDEPILVEDHQILSQRLVA